MVIDRYLIKKAKEKIKAEREARFLRKKISQLEMEGEAAFHQGLYLNSFKCFVEALKLKKTNLKNYPEVIESIDQLKTKIDLAEYGINKEKIDQVQLIIENEDKLKNEKKFNEAYEEYQKAHKLIEEMVIFDGNKREQKVNEIYLKQIQILIEKGNELKSQNEINVAVKILNKALDLAVRVLTSTERDQIVIKIKKILDSYLDIYSDKIREKIDLGNQLMKQEKFDEAILMFKSALNYVTEKYRSLTDSVSNRFDKTNEIRDINSLINQSESEIIKSPPMKTSKIKVEYNDKRKEEEKLKVTYNTCNFCGQKLSQEGSYCPQCGMKITEK